MAVKPKALAENNIATTLAQFHKDFGKNVGNFGGHQQMVDRIPTGLFSLDLAMAGGFPRGRCSTIFGPESSNKTNIALLAVKHHQELYPAEVCVFVAIEGFDPAWAKLLGVDTERLLVVYPPYAENAVDMIEAAMHSDDCGMVVLDSLAAMLSVKQSAKGAEEGSYGGNSQIVGDLVRKTNQAMIQGETNGKPRTLIYINQIRTALNVKFGNPEKTPGGWGPLYQSSIRLRVYGKNVMNPKISTVMPVLKDVQFTIPKWKVPILSPSGAFSMCTHPHDCLEVGDTDDFGSIKTFLTSLGNFEKHPKKGWVILGEHYNTQDDFSKRLYEDRQFGRSLRESLIKKLLEENAILDATPT